jgi:hypothetical protein
MTSTHNEDVDNKDNDDDDYSSVVQKIKKKK